MGSSIRSAKQHSHHLVRLGSVALTLVWVGLIAIAQAVPALASGGGGNSPSLVISSPNPPSGPAGTNIVVSGANWHSGEAVSLAIGTAGGSCATTTPISGGATGTPDGTGAVQITFAWPNTLTNGTYPLCGSSSSISTVKTSNGFVSLGQNAPTLTLPATAASGATVTVSGANWLPSGTQVELHWGASGTNGCATLLTTLTSAGDGSLNGSITLPSFAKDTQIVVAATSPAGACGQLSPPPSLVKTATITVTGNGGGSGATPTPAPGGGTATPIPGRGTPTPGTGSGTPTPGAGNGTPTPGTGTPGSKPSPTPNGGSGGGNSGGGSGPCPPLPDSFCSPSSNFPWWLLCLMLLGLFLLFLILLLVLISRRNQQVVVQEEDITSQIDPNSVAPMGSMRFVRAVRVTSQVVDSRTGRVLNSRARDFDEFADSNGNIQRRPRP